MSILTIDKFLPDEPPYSSNEIAGLFFKNADIINPSTWMTIVNESETVKNEEWLNLEKAQSNEDKFLASLEGYVVEPVIITEKAPVTYQIFISDDGDKLNYLVNNTVQGQPKSNEILIFIEADKDVFSKRILHVKVGGEVTFNNMPMYQLIHPITEIPKKKLIDLLKASDDKKKFEDEFLLYVRLRAQVKEFAFSQISSGLKKAIDKINSEVKIGEDKWNPDKGNKTINFSIFHGMDAALKRVIGFTSNIEKIVKKRRLKRFDKIRVALSTVVHQLNKALEILYEINNFIKKISDHVFALVVGVWNGLVDMINGLIFLIKLVFDGAKLVSKGTRKAAEFAGDNDYRATIEQMDNVMDSLRKINLVKVFSNILTNGKEIIGKIDFNQFAQKLKSGAKNAGKKAKEAFSLSTYEIAYYIGYVATFFIPVGWIAAVLGKLGKVGKLLGGTLKWVDDMMGRLVGVTIKGLQKAAKPLTEFLRAFAKKLAGGTNAMIKGVQDIFHAIKRWLAGFLHNVLEDVLKLWRIADDTIKLIKEFGVILIRGGDDRLVPAYARNNNYSVFYEGQTIKSGPEEVVRAFMKKLEKIHKTPKSRGGGENGVKKELQKNASKLSRKALKKLDDLVEEARIKWKILEERAGVAAVLQGKVNGKELIIGKYTAKGIHKDTLTNLRHPVINHWLNEIAEKALRNRRTHGRCAEPLAISEYLFEAEKLLGIAKGKMTMEQAKKVLSGTVSKAKRIHNSKDSKLAHGLHKSACKSCNPLLSYFKIIEDFN